LEKRKGRRDAGGTKEEKADPSPRKNREVRDDRVEQISAGASESRGPWNEKQYFRGETAARFYSSKN
jgi:hypothetical protein